ncbi:MAG: Mur ligase family protein [Candidatus Omnitrophota bacterium]
MMSYKNKKVTVVGLARSGVAASRLLCSLGARVFVTEEKSSPELVKLSRDLKKEGMGVELAGHTRDCVEGCDVMVLSPGVRPDSAPVAWAGQAGIPVISEIELAWSVCRATVIAVSGTNGKTTTTTLIAEILKSAGRTCYALGNIGTPFSSKVVEMKEGDYVSLEVSSFQLEFIRSFKPRVALILNMTPDHLDRYKSVEEYLNAKKRIFMNQTKDDWLILNETDEALKKAAGQARSRVLFFGKAGVEDAGMNQNQQAVLAAARALDVERKTVLSVFRDFKGVEHRLEFVRDLNGVTFINDSKATNIDSTVWALNNMKKPVILIAGGRDKGSDFSSIVQLIGQKVKFAVLVGEAASRIALAWKGAVPFETVSSFPEAVRLARTQAESGDCVLFSPMCKSFDMFTDYEHRGRTFKEIVAGL